MKLAHAQSIAEYLVAEMEPYCERVGIAGSIRRQSPEVKDIEIVVIAKWGTRPIPGSLFPEDEPYNVLYEHMQSRGDERWGPLHKYMAIDWIKPGSPIIEPWHIKPTGKYWRGLIGVADGAGPVTTIKLDLFLARPENWGVIYTIRTGSADFSRELVTYARDKTPYRVLDGELRFSGPVPCPDEETLFAALQLKWIEPPARRGAGDIIPL